MSCTQNNDESDDDLSRHRFLTFCDETGEYLKTSLQWVLSNGKQKLLFDGGQSLLYDNRMGNAKTNTTQVRDKICL